MAQHFPFPWPEEWHDRVLDYAEHMLGMTLDGPEREPPEIVAIAYEALRTPLPKGWTMNTTPDGAPYYWYPIDAFLSLPLPLPLSLYSSTFERFYECAPMTYLSVYQAR